MKYKYVVQFCFILGGHHLLLRRARLVPSEKRGLLRRLGARSRCFCCLDPLPPPKGGREKRCSKTSRRRRHHHHHHRHFLLHAQDYSSPLPPPPPPPQLLLKVFVVARVIFKRRNPGAAEDGSVKVLIVARLSTSGGTQAPKRVCCGARRPGREPGPGLNPRPTHQHMRAAITRGLPPSAPHPHAPQGFFISGFFIVARSLNVRSPLLVRQAQWQWRSTREGRACKGCSYS